MAITLITGCCQDAAPSTGHGGQRQGQCSVKNVNVLAQTTQLYRVLAVCRATLGGLLGGPGKDGYGILLLRLIVLSITQRKVHLTAFFWEGGEG